MTVTVSPRAVMSVSFQRLVKPPCEMEFVNPLAELQKIPHGCLVVGPQLVGRFVLGWWLFGWRHAIEYAMRHPSCL